MQPHSSLALTPAASRAASGSWTNDADGNWSATMNWQGDVVATGADAIAYFTNAITAPRMVSNDITSNSIGHLFFAPNGANGWTLSGSPLTFQVSAGSPTATVASGSAAVSAMLLGTQGMVKAGAGVLQLLGNNTFTGTTLVTAGNLVLTGGVLNSRVDLAAGTMLSAQMGQGLVGEYYYVGAPNVNNQDPAFATLPQLQTYMAGYSPNLLFNGEPFSTNFDFGSSGGAVNTNFPPNVPTQNFQTRWKGIFNAPADGTYYFGTASDDCSMLWVDGTNVVYNNYFQPLALRGGTIGLAAGTHEIVFAYNEGGGGYGFYADIALPGGTTNRLPLAMLQTGPAIGSITGAVNSVLDLSNAPIIVAQSTDGNFDGVLTGGNPLRKIGAGRLTLTANNSAFTGGLIFEGGAISIANDVVLGAASAPMTFAGGILRIYGGVPTTIDSRNVNWSSFNGGFDLAPTNLIFTITNSLGGAGSLVKQGAGLLVLSATNTLTGMTTVSSGTLDIAVSGAIWSTTVQVNAGSQIILQSSNALATNCALSLWQGVAGYGKVSLTNGANLTVAALYLNGAIQKVGTYGATGSGAVFVNDNYFIGTGTIAVTTGVGSTPTDGSWAVNANGDWGQGLNWISNQIAIGTNATAYFTNATTFSVAVNNAYTPIEIGNLYFYPTNAFSWTVTNGAMTLATTSGVPPTITVGSNNATVGSSLQGSQGFMKAGAGQLILTVNNPYSGTTTVSQGALQLAASGTLFNAGTLPGAMIVNGGASIVFNRSDALGIHTNNAPAAMTINAGGLVFNTGAVFNTINNLTLNGGELRANGGVSTNFQAFQIKGAVTVGGTNASLISATKSINATNQIQLGNNQSNGTTTINVADVTGDANADLIVSAGFADGHSTSGSYPAVPSGFVKTGPGKMLLSGNNINTGPSSLSGGELVVSGAVVNAPISLSSTAMVTAAWGPGIVGEYYFTGVGTNPLAVSQNTLQNFANHLASPSLLMTEVYNGPNNSTNFDFIVGGWPPNLYNSQYYEGRWVGKYIAPTSGVYVFATASDDGSMLWIDGTNVVNNNFDQGTTGRTGTVALVSGLHDIVIAYRQGTGGYTLNASNMVPGAATNTLIPLSSLQTAPAIGALSGVAGAVVNVSNAPITIAQMSDGSYAGSFAGTNTVRKVGHGILALTADNSSFPGVFELGGGRVEIAQNNYLPANAVFNGGVLRIPGTSLTAARGYGINWSTFIGGFEIADPANIFTITNNIGSMSAFSSLWKFGPGTLPMVGNSNVLNLGLNVMTGQVTMVQNYTAVNGGLNISRGTLMLTNAFMQNISNNTDSVGYQPFDNATMTIGGTSQFYKTQNNLIAGNAANAAGTVVLKDSALYSAAGSSLYFGNPTGSKGVLTVQDSTTLRTTGGSFMLANSVGSTGVMYQTGGSLAMNSDFNFGRNAGGYGFLLRTGGSATNTGNTQNGGGLGLFYQQGGLYSQAGSVIQLGNNVGGSGTGVLWMTGGSITSTVNFVDGQAPGTRSEFSVAGGAIYAPNIVLNNNSNNSAILNLNGGVLQVGNIFKQYSTSTNIVNISGGTVQARANGNLFGAGGTNSPDNIYIHGSGVTLDSGISVANIAPNLIAPPGNGVAGIAITNSGSGYIGAPYVFISGGGGTGATAVAQLNLAAGTVTNIVITSPGVNYASAPTATLVGGGFTTPAGLGAVATAPNISGGVTIKGSGSIALLGTNTYGGATIISNGILLVSSTNAIPGTLTLATNTVGIGSSYPMDQAFINWLTSKVTGASSGGVLALGTNSANNLDLTGLTNWSLGAGGQQIFSGGLTLPSTNVYLGGGGGNLIYQPNLVTGTNYFIGQFGGNPFGVVTFSGTNDSYSSGIIVQGGTLRASSSRTNSFGSSNATVTILSGATLDVNGTNQNKVQVFVKGQGVNSLGAIVNSSNAAAIPALQFVTLTGDATFGNNPSRWDIRDAALGPKLDLAGYTMTKTGGAEVVVFNTEVTDGSINIGQGIFRFEVTSTATSGVGTITVGPSGNLDFWNFSGNVTRPVTIRGGNVSVGAGTATVGSPFTLLGVTNSFTPAVGATLFPTNQISGGGILCKMGVGTMKLPIPAAYSGATHVNLGTLELAVNDPINGALSSSSGVIVQNGGTLRFDYDQCLFGANVRPLTIGNGGFISTSNGVAYQLDKPFTLAGGIITGGTPHVTSGNWIITTTNVPVTALSSIVAPRTQLGVPSGVIFDVTNNAGLVISGTLESPGGSTGALIKTGSGTMTITSTNTYQGATIIANGTLKLAAFAPAGGASVWYDASDLSTITRDPSGFISQWSDKSGNGRNATQTTNGLKPTLITNSLLGKTVVNFSGSPQIMNADLSFFANNGYSIFAVEGRTNNNNNSYFVGTQSNNSNYGLHFGYRLSNQFTLAQFGNDLNTAVGQPAPYTTQQFRLWDGIFDFANQYLYLDTTNVGTRATVQPFLPNPGPGVIGCGLVNYFYQGDLAEILIYNRSVSTYERQQIESYLRQKWFGATPPALANLLPVNTALQIGPSAIFDLGGVNQTIGSLGDYGLGGGNITNTVALPVTLNAGGDNSTTTFSGMIADGVGTVALTKAGSGILTLNGLSRYSGATEISGGSLIVNGTIGAGQMTIDVGCTLGGTGVVGGTALNIGGIISPGASAGRLTLLGDLYDAGTINIELDGTVAGSTYDQLVVGGSANLMGDTLNVTATNYVPVAGDTFTILAASNGLNGTSFVAVTLPTLADTNLGWRIDYTTNLPGAVILSVTSAPTGYDAWAAQIVGTNTAYNQSALNDGYPNLLKYATGSSPTTPDNLASMSAARLDGILQLLFNHDTNATDIRLIVEGAYTSTNDATWNGIATNIAGSWGSATNVVENTATNPASVTVSDIAGPSTNRFLRLRVTRP